MNGDHALANMDLLARPIIQIGAGRSGSTLFTRLLNSHPRIQFFGETQFLLPRLWQGVWENSQWFNHLNFPKYFPSYPTQLRSSNDATAALRNSIDESMMKVQRERVARLLCQLFGDILQVGNDVDAWGYKEVWNGNKAETRHCWETYNSVFPEATWVHLVRCPFDFLKSVARWNVKPLTKKFVVNVLSQWMQMIEWNRKQSTRRKFIEIRYEDLVSDPRKALLPVFSMAEIEWSDDCLTALSSSVMHSREGSSFPAAPPLTRKQLKGIVAQVAGLENCLDELGYDLPETFPREIMKTNTRSGRSIKDLFIR